MLEPVEEAVIPRPCGRRQTRGSHQGNSRVLARLARAVQLPGTLARDGAALGAHAEASTYKPTGAIVAAPTTSLPEQIGGPRNWDYRYTWIRDSAFSLHALLLLGFHDAAEQFMGWLTDRFREVKEGEVDRLRVMYRVDGSSDLEEEELDHLEGYCGSRPVRVGNEASTQLQLDIYGELIDAIYVHNKYGGPDLLRRVGRNPRRRRPPRREPGTSRTRASGRRAAAARTSSSLACSAGSAWTGPRGSRCSGACPPTSTTRRAVRDRIHAQIHERGWNEKKKAFVQYYGATCSRFAPDDAAGQVHLADRPALAFDPRRDQPTSSSPTACPPLQPEVPPDGLERGRKGRSRCARSGVEAMSPPAGGRGAADLREDADLREPRRSLLEQITERRGARNFPQAFTHLALISAAFDLTASWVSAGAL